MPAAGRLVTGAGLVVAGGTHLWIWFHGYRGTAFGPGFLADAFLSGLVGGLVLLRGNRLAVWAGSFLAAGSLVAYATARTVGLLGFVERQWTLPSLIAAGCEAIVLVVLVTEALVPEAADSNDGGRGQPASPGPWQTGPRHTGPVAGDVTVWFNPSCSKCRATKAVLAECNVGATFVEYLRDAPSRAELECVLGLLGTDDPLAIARPGEPRFAELGLAIATRDEVLDALAANPVLIERPIVIRGNRAIIARPPERVRELLE